MYINLWYPSNLNSHPLFQPHVSSLCLLVKAQYLLVVGLFSFPFCISFIWLNIPLSRISVCVCFTLQRGICSQKLLFRKISLSHAASHVLFSWGPILSTETISVFFWWQFHVCQCLMWGHGLHVYSMICRCTAQAKPQTQHSFLELCYKEFQILWVMM